MKLASAFPRPNLPGMSQAPQTASKDAAERADAFRRIFAARIVVLDGAMGSMIQTTGLVPSRRPPSSPRKPSVGRSEQIISMIRSSHQRSISVTMSVPVVFVSTKVRARESPSTMSAAVLETLQELIPGAIVDGVLDAQRASFTAELPVTAAARRDRLNRALTRWFGAEGHDPVDLFDVLLDEQCPVSGDPPIFIRNDIYGTRCSTLVAVDGDGGALSVRNSRGVQIGRLGVDAAGAGELGKRAPHRRFRAERIQGELHARDARGGERVEQRDGVRGLQRPAADGEAAGEIVLRHESADRAERDFRPRVHARFFRSPRPQHGSAATEVPLGTRRAGSGDLKR